MSIFTLSLIYIFALLIKCSYQRCGTFNPGSAGQCYYYSTDNNLCCLLGRYEGPRVFYSCYNIPLSSYVDVVEKGYIELGDFVYTSIECGLSPGLSCSATLPLVPEDCYVNNLSDSNCCMIEPPSGIKRCVYSGNTKVAEFVTPNGIKIKCGPTP